MNEDANAKLPASPCKSIVFEVLLLSICEEGGISRESESPDE